MGRVRRLLGRDSETPCLCPGGPDSTTTAHRNRGHQLRTRQGLRAARWSPAASWVHVTRPGPAGPPVVASSPSSALKQRAVYTGGKQRGVATPLTSHSCSTGSSTGAESSCRKAQAAFRDLRATGRLARQPGFKPPDRSALLGIPASWATPFSSRLRDSSRSPPSRATSEPPLTCLSCQPTPTSESKVASSSRIPSAAWAWPRLSQQVRWHGGRAQLTDEDSVSCPVRSPHIRLQPHLGSLTKRTPVCRPEPQRGLVKWPDCPRGSRDTSQEICPGRRLDPGCAILANRLLGQRLSRLPATAAPAPSHAAVR